MVAGQRLEEKFRKKIWDKISTGIEPLEKKNMQRRELRENTTKTTCYSRPMVSVPKGKSLPIPPVVCRSGMRHPSLENEKGETLYKVITWEKKT